MGTEINLYLNMGARLITASVKTSREPDVNQPHVLEVNLEDPHLFDNSTEKTIS